MRLADLRLVTMPPTWSSAMRVGMVWFPDLAGSIESRWMMHQGRVLLSAIALHIRETSPEAADMERVRAAIDLETKYVGALLVPLSLHPCREVARIAEVTGKERGNVIDPVQLLLLNLTDWRVTDVGRRWPFKLGGAPETC